jgi:acyl-CoA thioesterase
MTGRAEDERQELAERVVADMLAHDAFSRWLGVELVEVRPRAATVRMMVRAEMTNGFGVCHGGVTFALADSALAFASNTHGRVTMSIENSITYPAAVSVGDVLLAAAVEEAASARVAYYRVTVTRQDLSTVALFRGTVYRTKRPHAVAEGLLQERQSDE